MKAFFTFSFLAIFLCGCVASAPPSSGLKYVKLGMTKEQVAEKIGEPTVARGGLKNKFGQTVEVYEYRLALPSDDSAGQVVGKSVATIFSAGLAASAFRESDVISGCISMTENSSNGDRRGIGVGKPTESTSIGSKIISL
jgi:hypothetical protein